MACVEIFFALILPVYSLFDNYFSFLQFPSGLYILRRSRFFFFDYCIGKVKLSNSGQIFSFFFLWIGIVSFLVIKSFSLSFVNSFIPNSFQCLCFRNYLNRYTNIVLTFFARVHGNRSERFKKRICN